MTTPWTGPGLSPLQLYLREERAGLAALAKDLQDASADAQRRLVRLAGKEGLGAQVRRQQLALIRRELALTQRALWAAVGTTIRSVSPAVADAAMAAEQAMEAVLFRRVGARVPDGFVEAQQTYARSTVRAYLARNENGISLSRRVFRTEQLAKGFVDRAINRVLLQGGSWKDLADRVRPLIQPETPGGVSFAAKRLARTELNNAFHTAARAVSAANPYSDGMQWHLSGSHRRADPCDELARGHSPGRRTGVYDDGEVPAKPHPQCLCFVASVPISERDFLALFSVPSPPAAAPARRSA